MDAEDMNLYQANAEDAESATTGENPEVIDNLQTESDISSRAIVAREEQQDQVPHEQEATDDPQEPPRDPHGPRSPFLPFSILLPLLALQLPPQDMERISVLCREYEAGNITRQTLVHRVRLHAGDDLLQRTIEIFAPPLQEYTRGMGHRRRGGRGR